MLAALRSFDTSTSSESSRSATNFTQSESDKRDEIMSTLIAKEVMVQKAQDALFVAIHALLLEAGYKLLESARTEFALPENWNANSANGLFTVVYVHPNDDSVKFTLQGLFVRRNFKVYISDDKDHTHSIELSVDKFIASGEFSTPVSAASLLYNLGGLRKEFKPFAESLRPAKTKEIAPPCNNPAFIRSPDQDDQIYSVPVSTNFPPVGRGDAFPSGVGGGNPDMLVGPDHPLFGHRGDPSIGPVPGARFDPFGPSIDPLGPSGGFRPPSRGPAPTMPFGGPGPDHLRMPRDDEMDPGFGFHGGSRGGGGFSQSKHPFF